MVGLPIREVGWGGQVSALHVDAERHAACVWALFKQLDTAHAWDRGETCEALGTPRAPCAPCAFALKVRDRVHASRSSGVRRTRPRCEDLGLGRVDRRDPRPAKWGVLEAEVSKK